MVRVAPEPTVRFAVTLYGPPAAVQVLAPDNAPETLTTDPSSYQIRAEASFKTVPDPSSACAVTVLMPGRSAKVMVQVPCTCDQLANCPFTFTERVVMTFPVPFKATVAEGLW